MKEDVLRLVVANLVSLPAEIVTYLGVKKYGVYHEASELSRELFKKIGVVPTFILRHLLVSGFVLYLLWARKINWLTRLISDIGYYCLIGTYTLDSLLDSYNWIRWEVLK